MGYADIKKRRAKQGEMPKRNEHLLKDSAAMRESLGKAIATFLVFSFVGGILYFPNTCRPDFAKYAIFALLPSFALAFIVFVCCFRSASRREKNGEGAVVEHQRNVVKEELDQWARQLERNGGLTPVAASIALKQDEAVFYKSSSHLFEVRSVRVTNHAGGAMRVSRRVSLGGGQSVSESHEEWRPITRGDLYLTNKRVVFVGEMQSRTFDLKNVVSVKGGSGMLEVVSETRAKSMRFTVANWAIAKLTLEFLVKTRGEPLSTLMNTSGPIGDMASGGALKADVENPYSNGIDYSTVRLIKCLCKLLSECPALRSIDSIITVPPAIRDLFANSPVPAALCFAVIEDAMKCQLRLGHDFKDLNTEAGFGLLSIIWMLVVPNAIDNIKKLTSDSDVYYKSADLAKRLCNEMRRSVSDDDSLMSVSVIKEVCSAVLYDEYIEALSDWATAIAAVDGEVTVVEQRWLQYLLSLKA